MQQVGYKNIIKVEKNQDDFTTILMSPFMADVKQLSLKVVILYAGNCQHKLRQVHC